MFSVQFTHCLYTRQALTLSFCTKQSVGPVYVKSHCPSQNKQKSYWPETVFIDLKNTMFCNTSHYKSKDASLTAIYFAVGDLLSVSIPYGRQRCCRNRLTITVLSVEAAGAAGRILRTTSDAATYVSSYRWLYSKKRTGPDTVYNYDCYKWVYFFRI